MCQESSGKDLLCLKFYKVECNVHYVCGVCFPWMHPCLLSIALLVGLSQMVHNYTMSVCRMNRFSHMFWCAYTFSAYSYQGKSFLFCRIFAHTPNVCILSRFIFPLIFAMGTSRVVRGTNQCLHLNLWCLSAVIRQKFTNTMIGVRCLFVIRISNLFLLYLK